MEEDAAGGVVLSGGAGGLIIAVLYAFPNRIGLRMPRMLFSPFMTTVLVGTVIVSGDRSVSPTLVLSCFQDSYLALR